MPAALSSASILEIAPVSTASRATVRLLGVPFERPPVLGLGIYFSTFLLSSTRAPLALIAGLAAPAGRL
jgi:hypothetical protein